MTRIEMDRNTTVGTPTVFIGNIIDTVAKVDGHPQFKIVVRATDSDGPAQFLTVHAYQSLGANVLTALDKGDKIAIATVLRDGETADQVTDIQALEIIRRGVAL